MGDYEGQTAILYARVSTDDKEQRPEVQIGTMKEWAAKEGIRIVGEYIEEKSGKDMARPQLQAAIGRIVAGSLNVGVVDDPLTCKVNILLAWHPTRISRDSNDLMNIKKLVESYGCYLRFVSNPIKTESDIGKLITMIDGWHGEMERKKISDNTKMGMRQSKFNGQYLSRPLRVVFQEDLEKYKYKGMIRTDDAVKHKTRITTETDVYGWASEGYSVKRIATEKLYVPYSTFYGLLKETGRLEKVQSLFSMSKRVSVEQGSSTGNLNVEKGMNTEVSVSTPFTTVERDSDTEKEGSI